MDALQKNIKIAEEYAVDASKVHDRFSKKKVSREGSLIWMLE